MITLFAEPPRSSGFPSTFVVSILLHASALSLLTVKVMNSHRIVERFAVERYSLRVLDFHSTEPYVRQSSPDGIVYRGPRAESKVGSQSAQHSAASSQGSAGSPPVSRQAPRLLPAAQTLVQPDLSHTLVIPENTPVPLVVLWSPDKVATPRIVPPLPEKPTIVVVHPTLETPIKEENLADVRISSTIYATQSLQPPPSTTSPVVVHGPEDVKKITETTSTQPEKPTPARVISLSDIRMPEGKVAVPLANQASSKAPVGTMIPGVLKEPAPTGNGDSNNKKGLSGSGKGTGNHPSNKGEKAGSEANAAIHANKGAHVAKNAKPDSEARSSGPSTSRSASALRNKSGSRPAAGGEKQDGPDLPVSQTGASEGLQQGAVPDSGSANQPPNVHISLPRDGQFGAVILGSSIEDKYPETAELWSGRLASTVYLHVGLAKSWILQYALPRLADAAVNSGRLEAPWPFEIVRPSLNPDEVDTDALILHGFLNKEGRFEKLEVVYPPQFPKSQMVANVINEWQFRPAKQNGQLTPVEVLLIIPEQME